jgi:hypothetical protein
MDNKVHKTKYKEQKRTQTKNNTMNKKVYTTKTIQWTIKYTTQKQYNGQ